MAEWNYTGEETKGSVHPGKGCRAPWTASQSLLCPRRPISLPLNNLRFRYLLTIYAASCHFLIQHLTSERKCRKLPLAPGYKRTQSLTQSRAPESQSLPSSLKATEASYMTPESTCCRRLQPRGSWAQNHYSSQGSG